MIIIIDGYNLIRSMQPSRQVTEQERNQYIKWLSHYAKLKGHKIIMVFDAGPSEWPSKEKMNGVTVIYAGHNTTADEYIMHLMEEKKKSDLLLVSSDHEINVVASSLNIPSIGAMQFFDLVQEAVTKESEPIELPQGQAKKISKHSHAELDTLMHASEPFEVKEEDKAFESRVKRQKLSKQQRKLWSKLKKL